MVAAGATVRLPAAAGWYGVGVLLLWVLIDVLFNRWPSAGLISHGLGWMLLELGLAFGVERLERHDLRHDGIVPDAGLVQFPWG